MFSILNLWSKTFNKLGWLQQSRLHRGWKCFSHNLVVTCMRRPLSIRGVFFYCVALKMTRCQITYRVIFLIGPPLTTSLDCPPSPKFFSVLVSTSGPQSGTPLQHPVCNEDYLTYLSTYDVFFHSQMIAQYDDVPNLRRIEKFEE